MLPQHTIELIDDFTRQSQAILRDNLVGVYLHGSAVMGCFNPEKSDLDFIIVVKDKPTDADKAEYMNMVVNLNAKAPAKGIEFSVVLQSVCKPFAYPTPFELHFSITHLAWYRADPDGYIQKMNGTDKDLAAHFTIIVKRGVCLCGSPIKHVFAEIPSDNYIDSIWYDVQNAAAEIADNTMYLTLNLARVLAYKRQALILSKKEAAEWALEMLPEEYAPLIRAALNEYTNNENIVYDKQIAERYAKYALERIGQ